MNHHASKLVKGLLATCILACVAIVIILASWFREGVYLSTVAGKVSLLVEMEEWAREPQPLREVAVSAARASSMIPREVNSSADIVLSLVASNTVRNLCSILRQQTGTNYGDDPERWVQLLSTGASAPKESNK